MDPNKEGSKLTQKLVRVTQSSLTIHYVKKKENWTAHKSPHNPTQRSKDKYKGEKTSQRFLPPHLIKTLLTNLILLYV